MKPRSATAKQLDEKFDVYVSRPLAKWMARGFHQLGFSADQVSMMALAAGLGASVCIATGGLWSVLGGLLLVAMVITDCADGAVARMNPPSDRPWRGRMLDGFADLGTVLAVHVAMVIALAKSNIVLGGYAVSTLEIVLLAAAGLVSFSWKSSIVDDIKQRLKDSSPDHDIEKYRAQTKSPFEKFLWFWYVWYVHAGERMTGPGRPGGYEVFRLVAIVGPSHHLVAIAMAAVVAPLAPTVFLTYFLLTSIPGNLYLWYVLSRARRHAAGVGAALE